MISNNEYDTALKVVTLIVTAVGVITAMLYNAINIKNNSKTIKSNWIFNVTMEFHKQERLYRVFNEIQYDTFSFTCLPHKWDGDLSSCKEADLIYFLDFLNSICAAVEQQMIGVEYLQQSTLGYAIEMTSKNESVVKYLEHVAQYDDKRKSQLRSFSFLKKHQSFSHLRMVAKKITP